MLQGVCRSSRMFLVITWRLNRLLCAESLNPTPEDVIPIGFFVKGMEQYKALWLFPAQRHLFGPKDSTKPFYLLGADRLGQDCLAV